MVQGEAGTIHKAKTGGAPGNLGDECCLTKAQFPNALAEAFIALHRADTGGRADRKLAEGKWLGEVVRQLEARECD